MDALNTASGTDFKAWHEVVPPGKDVIKEPGEGSSGSTRTRMRLEKCLYSVGFATMVA